MCAECRQPLDLKFRARTRKITLLIIPTDQAIRTLAQEAKDTNAILHVNVLSDSPLLLRELGSFRNLGKPLRDDPYGPEI